MVAAPFRFLSLLREHQPEKGFFKWFAVSACNRNTLPGFHEDFGRVEMVYIRKVDKVTAVTLEKAFFQGKQFLITGKRADRLNFLTVGKCKNDLLILCLETFDIMQIDILIAGRCV